MNNLSPTAQAVLDAYVDEDRAGRLAVAAALRAAADQLTDYSIVAIACNKLRAIAAELEETND